MEYRRFGNTDLMVSEIGFGAWAIGGAANVGGIEIGWGISDDDESIKALYAAVDAGINFFDTADFYGLGYSEELIGKTVANLPDVIVATKVGQRVGTDGKIAIDYTKGYLLEACNQSLRRLKRDTIDYYQLHVAKTHHLDNGECIEAMQLLQQQGKIKYWGISINTFNPQPEAAWMINHALGNGFQLVLNIINQTAVPLLIEAAENGYGIIARMPLQFGLLGGKMKEDTSFAKDDHRSTRLTAEIISKANDLLANHVAKMAERYETSLASLALSFVLSFPEISTVIPGIRTVSHVQQNTTGIVHLEEDDKQLLTKLSEGDAKDLLDLMLKQG